VKFLGKTFAIAFLSFFAISAHAAERAPFQLSLVHPLQIYPRETQVRGLRINLLYGVNDEVKGLDVGVVNRTTGLTQGLQYGVVNITEKLNGLQFSGIYVGANIATEDVSGGQIFFSLVGFNKSGNVKGLQLAGLLAGLNMAKDLKGTQISGILGVNLAENTTGVQLATLYNQAEEMKGVQIGLVNICRQMTGVQIGLANIIKESEVPFFPIVNARF